MQLAQLASEGAIHHQMDTGSGVSCRHRLHLGQLVILASYIRGRLSSCSHDIIWGSRNLQTSGGGCERIVRQPRPTHEGGHVGNVHAQLQAAAQYICVCIVLLASHLAHEGRHVGNMHAQLQAAVRQPRRAQCVVHIRATCAEHTQDIFIVDETPSSDLRGRVQLQAAVRQLRCAQCIVHIRAACDDAKLVYRSGGSMLSDLRQSRSAQCVVNVCAACIYCAQILG